MRLSPSVRRLLACVLFMAYGAVVVFGHALVRCHEADGSANIEWRGAECCVPRAAGDAERPVTSAISSEDAGGCGRCSDKPMADDLASTKPQRAPSALTEIPDAPSSPPLLAIEMSVAFATTRNVGPRHTLAPIPPPPLAALRTVVLRC